MRKYKEDTPENTILKIQRLLCDTNIVVYQSNWINPVQELYSVRLETSEQTGLVGQNGKGKNKPYALASAYAEFAERLQNGIITIGSAVEILPCVLQNRVAHHTGYYLFPDETYATVEEVMSLPEQFLIDTFGIQDFKELGSLLTTYVSLLNKNGISGILSIPFKDIKKNQILNIPYYFLLASVGSNGMAAGNTDSEAIFQGTCELLERYAGSIVFYNQQTPPSIPDEVLKDFSKEFYMIEHIRQAGFEVIIKDFSCGLNLPVVGSIIINPLTNKYKLDLGCDTNFDVALSRSLTEAFQGIPKENFDLMALDIPTKEYSIFTENDKDSIDQRVSQFNKFKMDGSGVFPKALFDDRPSYNSDLSTTFCPQNSYEDEVKYLFSLINKLDSSIYVRDSSLFGFPSFFIYATEISSAGKKTTGFDFQSNFLSYSIKRLELESLIFPLADFWYNEEKIIQFLKFQTRNIDSPHYKKSMQDVLCLQFYDTYWTSIPLSFFISIFHLIIGNFTESLNYFEKYLEHINSTESSYYKEVVKYLKALSENKPDDYIKQNINDEVVYTFSKQNIFNTVDLPACSHCEKCKLSEKCLTKGKIELNIKRLTKFKKSEEVF